MIKNYFKDFNPKSFDANDLLVEWLKYMDDFPSLKRYCIEDYKEDWKDIALEKVFIYNEKSFLRMKEITNILNKAIHQVINKAKQFFEYVDLPEIDWIIYHGLGNGAGGYTKLDDKNVIMFGVEKILELNWDQVNKLEDLVAHEYTHYIHETIRGSQLELSHDFKTNHIYRLYVEGLATYGESIMHGRKISMPDWYKLCLEKENLLKKKFNGMLNEENEAISHFFGDWYPVEKIIEAGYFLGMKMIENWHKSLSLENIMKAPYREIKQAFNEYITCKGMIR